MNEFAVRENLRGSKEFNKTEDDLSFKVLGRSLEKFSGPSTLNAVNSPLSSASPPFSV